MGFWDSSQERRPDCCSGRVLGSLASGKHCGDKPRPRHSLAGLFIPQFDNTDSAVIPVAIVLDGCLYRMYVKRIRESTPRVGISAGNRGNDASHHCRTLLEEIAGARRCRHCQLGVGLFGMFQRR
jgi:hypothetical protein